jgi:flagellar hook-associated protein 1 FlgK
MSLAVALNTARSSLATTAKQLAVSGGNIAGADDPNRTRKIATPSTDADGSVRVVSVTRATDLPVFYRLLASRATTGGQNALVNGLTRLSDTIGDTADGTSPAARMAALAIALQAQANAPSDRNLAQASLTAAQTVVSTLALATQTVTAVRNQADADMADSVGRLNDLLAQFTTVNDSVVRKTISGEDVTDALDKRDALLGQISDEAGISVVTRANNDVAIYTDGGVTLFDKSARTVSFDPSTALAPGVTGKSVTIDGVPVTGANTTMALRTGNLAGLATLRDTVAPTYQAQLDELARGLIDSFAESDQSGGGGSDLAGLFTWSGGPALPAAGALSSGLAASLAVNSAVDPSKGGNLDRIRDGGINGANYKYNASGAVGYGARLDGIVASLDAAQAFDSATDLQSGVSVLSFGTASVSWLEDQRKTASDTADYQNALMSRASEALSNSTGVNIDDEYATQLQLEQSYQASSKLIAVINAMFQTLLEAVG